MNVGARARLVAFAFLLSAALYSGGAASAGASDWNVQKLQYPRPFSTGAGPLLAISCPTTSLCVAGGALSELAASARPNGGPAAWNTYEGPEKAYTGPPPPPGAPVSHPKVNVRGVSCPTLNLCVAVTGSGDIYTTTDPLAGTAAWSQTNINDDEYETHLEAVSCPTSSFCVAVSGGPAQHNHPQNSGKVFSSHDPAGGAAAWKEVSLGTAFDLRGLSCASSSLCLAVGQSGLMVISTDPDGPASAWKTIEGVAGTAHLQGVGCVPGLCLAGNTAGNILSSIEPAAQSRSWETRNAGGSVPITGISCPSASRCLAVDDNGDVLSSSDPTGGSGAWTFQSVLPYVPKPHPELEPQLNGLFAVSCPSTALCAVAAADGTVLTSTDPFVEPPAGSKKGSKGRAKRPRTILAQVDRRHLKTDKSRLRMRFRFYSKGRPRGFLCRFDNSRWKPCASPTRVWADHGRHAFRVRAVGYTGLKGPIAVDHFRIYYNDDKCPCTPGSGSD